MLQIKGSAPYQWILEAKKLWRFIPGVTQLDRRNLVATELNQLQSYKQQIEQTHFLFEEGTTNLLPNQNNKIKDLKVSLGKLFDTAQYLNRKIRVQIVGHANTKGNEATNIILSKQRARKILNDLNSKGIKFKRISTVGVGSSQPRTTKTKKDMEKANIRVSFKVLLTDIKK